MSHSFQSKTTYLSYLYNHFSTSPAPFLLISYAFSMHRVISTYILYQLLFVAYFSLDFLCTSNTGAISRAVTVSPNVDAQLSKCCNPFLARVSYCKYLCTEYISTIEFEIGVPVAKITPRLPVISSR